MHRGAWRRGFGRLQPKASRKRTVRVRFGRGPVDLESLRGFQRTFDGVGHWPAVVIIVHPQAPELVLPQEPNTMWITLDDWLGLHDRLRSTAAVIGYVSRALASGLHPPLGREVDRYDLLADADQAAPGGPNSVPLLPLQSLDGDDEVFSLLITEMIEQAWKPDGFYPWTQADQYRRIVEDLDRIPPACRADLGRKMFDTYSKMRTAARRRSFLYLDKSQDGLFLFIYDSSDRWSEPAVFLAQVAAVAMTRFAHAQESGTAPSFALGAGVLVDQDRGVSYSFCHVETAELFDPEVRRLVEEEFGVFDGTSIVVASPP